jgi:hypothetical protein
VREGHEIARLGHLFRILEFLELFGVCHFLLLFIAISLYPIATNMLPANTKAKKTRHEDERRRHYTSENYTAITGEEPISKLSDCLMIGGTGVLTTPFNSGE